jgi:hypothetical protein
MLDATASLPVPSLQPDLTFCSPPPPPQFYQRLREGELTEDYLWETRLLPLLGYLAADEVVAVREALSLAYDAHAGQRRKSGEPFITHPVEVTRILAELRMDHESLAAGEPLAGGAAWACPREARGWHQPGMRAG